MQTTSAINCSSDKSVLNPGSNFFKQLQNLFFSEPKTSSQSSSYLPTPQSSFGSSFLDLQHVIDTLSSQTTWEPERSPSPVPEQPDITNSSNIFQRLYIPSGKWKWTMDHDIVDESCTFLSATAICSTYFKQGHVAGRNLKYICKSWETNTQLDNTFYSELALYKKQLKSLQGKCVPSVIGVFSGPGVLNVAMESPHSSFWIEASADMPLSLKQRCVDAIAGIHSCGVFHGDIQLRHMLIGGDARVTIVDFQDSAALEPNEKVFLSPATEADLKKEMRKVKVKLDFPGARLYETEKRERCLKRNKHNGDEVRKTILKPSYVPQLEEALEDDVSNPSILDMQEWQDWVAGPSLPRLFIVPRQSLQKRQEAYEAFLASLDSLSTQNESASVPFDDKPNGGPSSPNEQAQTELRERKVPLTELVESVHRPTLDLLTQSRPLGSSTILDNKGMHETHNTLDLVPPGLDPFPSPPQTVVSDHPAFLRVLAEFPAQSPVDPLPSKTRQPLNTETTQPHRSWLTRKRTASSGSQDSERPIKRTRLDDEGSGSNALFTTATRTSSLSSGPTASLLPTDSDSSSPSSSSKSIVQSNLGLGAYEWIPNLRYPSLPKAQKEEERNTWARVAMENLGNCALQELPHPDLIKLYPHHPRWAEPDVQVFLRRISRMENELAWTALQNPERRIAGPRHPRSLGNLKRSLREIQSNLEHSDAQIRGQEPSGPESETKYPVSVPSGNDVLNAYSQNRLSSPCDAPLALPRRVRFASPTTFQSNASYETTETPHTPTHCRQSWYQKPFSLLTQVFNWV
ncbi:hypothetical protein J3R30DRAFT_3697875 [Lentinula aciculospora]|uniref:Protein kinase domain-containing protein n=1 Tax=Lentinula aciculospora TaxID=153920 RepID=A0A9W9DVK4_9AGAR|nr:hypothetical protein J3R30DRAFT_3697875 [Lentinula aciculospora]